MDKDSSRILEVYDKCRKLGYSYINALERTSQELNIGEFTVDKVIRANRDIRNDKEQQNNGWKIIKGATIAFKPNKTGNAETEQYTVIDERGFIFAVCTTMSDAKRALKTAQETKWNDKEQRRELGNKKYGSEMRNGLVGRWESKGGKYWIELNKDGMGYSYDTNSGGGNMGNVSESSAIKDVEQMVKDSVQYDGINMRRVK
jgi:hypothetical protein